MSAFEVAGHSYRSSKRMSPMSQLHCARRVAPAWGAFMFASIWAKTGLSVPPAAQMMDSLARMPEDDFNYLVRECVGVCERLDGDKWLPIHAPGSSLQALQYMDIDGAALLQITVELLKENLGGFFPIGPSTSPDAKAAPATTG